MDLLKDNAAVGFLDGWTCYSTVILLDSEEDACVDTYYETEGCDMFIDV
jgi:hypothetical protein